MPCITDLKRLTSGLQVNKQWTNLPGNVREFGLPLICIIDATEIYIEQPKNPEVQQLTFSTYKNHNTLKTLIGISGNRVTEILP